MTLAERVEKDFLTAYKAKDELTTSVLRMLKTAMKNRLVELIRPNGTLGDEEVMEIILKQVKQRRESVEQFQAAGRKEMADREAAEIVVLEGFLPTPLTPEETAAAVDAAIAETGAASLKDMGRVMQVLSAAYKGRVDGSVLSGLVKARLGAK